MSIKDIKTQSRTDWARLETMTDEEIDYTDIPPLDEAFFQRAKLSVPKGRSILLDQDVFTWFEGQGNDYPIVINTVLRKYIEQKTKKRTKPKRVSRVSG